MKWMWVIVLGAILFYCTKTPETESDRMSKTVEECIEKSGGIMAVREFERNSASSSFSTDNKEQLRQEIRQKLTPAQQEELLKLYEKYKERQK